MDVTQRTAGAERVSPGVLGHTGPQGARTDYELLELLPQTGGQAFVFRGVLHGDRLGPGTDGTMVAVKQLITGAIGTSHTTEVVEVLRSRVHPALNRMLEVFNGPAPDPTRSPGDESLRDESSGHGSAGDGSWADESSGVDDTLVYVTSEWIPGRTADEAATTATLPEILRWVTEIAGAVDYLHAPGHRGGPVCHRDIKPHNVIVDARGDAVLIDPGLARLVAGPASGSPHGSPGYIPPECVLDPHSSAPAGDRWQVGALLYALLVGEPPGRAEPDLLRRRLLAASRWRLPGSVVDGVVAMLRRDPAQRPVLAHRWALDLSRDSSSPRARATVLARCRASRRTGRRALLGTGAVLALLAAGSIGWVAHRPPGRPPPPPIGTPPPAPGPAARGAFLPVDSLVHLAGEPGRTITVYNKVTNGAVGMREDDPAYLSTVPDTYCALYGCEVPGTEMWSGVRLTAVCQTIGEVTTNGDDGTPVDADNPGRSTTTGYYGIQAPGDRFGYLSWVWVAPPDRGGLGLRHCPDGLVR